MKKAGSGPNNVAQLIEEHFEVPLIKESIPKLVNECQDPDTWSYFLKEAFEPLCSNPQIPPRTERELRPLIGVAFTADPHENILFYPDEFDVERIKRVLLYNDKVYLVIHAEFFFEWNGQSAIDRGIPEQFFRFVYELKPLIENQIITFISQNHIRYSEQEKKSVCFLTVRILS
jgi:hypothetical protein